jgi:hypothetical protein
MGRTIRQERNVRVAERLKETWEKNYLANRPLIRKLAPLQPKLNRTPDLPALVVGAGPSLNNNIGDIDQYLYDIIAVDKVVPRLVANGIVPDYIVALNSVPTDVKKWIDCADEPDVTLVMPCTVDPATYEDWVGGEMMFINCPLDTGISMRNTSECNYPSLGIGSNAGTFGWFMALYLGHNPIAYCGIDFSFLTKEEVLRTHDYPTNYNIIEMTDRNGDVRYLDIGWLDMAESFQDSVRLYRELGNIETYNVTEGGINYSQYVHDKTLKEFNQLWMRK